MGRMGRRAPFFSKEKATELINEPELYVLFGLFATEKYIDKQDVGLLFFGRPEPW
jgi:hypothetical protein